jgi:hypothetical protein
MFYFITKISGDNFSMIRFALLQSRLSGLPAASPRYLGRVRKRLRPCCAARFLLHAGRVSGRLDSAPAKLTDQKDDPFSSLSPGGEFMQAASVLALSSVSPSVPDPAVSGRLADARFGVGFSPQTRRMADPVEREIGIEPTFGT